MSESNLTPQLSLAPTAPAPEPEAAPVESIQQTAAPIEEQAPGLDDSQLTEAEKKAIEKYLGINREPAPQPQPVVVQSVAVTQPQTTETAETVVQADTPTKISVTETPEAVVVEIPKTEPVAPLVEPTPIAVTTPEALSSSQQPIAEQASAQETKSETIPAVSSPFK